MDQLKLHSEIQKRAAQNKPKNENRNLTRENSPRPTGFTPDEMLLIGHSRNSRKQFFYSGSRD
ncbi:MAG TPA: hypothetical protein VFU15_00565 [Bacteroidia bacterium]|nr:hypothetical protein [Bacteroidia bacterium]